MYASVAYPENGVEMMQQGQDDMVAFLRDPKALDAWRKGSGLRLQLFDMRAGGKKKVTSFDQLLRTDES